MSRLGARHCFCCGAKESTGCGRGCGCESTSKCPLCTKCVQHHNRNCTPALREQAQAIELQAMLALVELRKANEINIFDYGEISL